MNWRARAVGSRYQHEGVQATCPVCRSEAARLLWAVTSSQAAQHFVLKERDAARYSELVSHIEGLWSGTRCEVVRCDVCGFCHSQPFIAGDARFYQLAYGEQTGYPKSKWEFQVTCDALAGCDHSHHTLLEIGAGDGAFIRAIADHVFRAETSLARSTRTTERPNCALWE